MSGLAELILAADDLPRQSFPCPEWPQADGNLFIRSLTGLERIEWEQYFVDPQRRTLAIPGNDPRAMVAGKALVDQFGGRVFSDEQIAALAGKSAVVLERAYDACLRLSGIRIDAKEDDANRKNSATTSGGDSATA